MRAKRPARPVPGKTARPFVRATPCTAAGNTPARSLLASPQVVAGVRERQAAGHVAAGREPPSGPPTRRAKKPVTIDDAVRDVVEVPRITEDEKLLSFPRAPRAEFTHTDPWRVMRITGEFVEGFDRLATLEKAVTVFGSARTPPGDPEYERAHEVARLLAR